MEKDWKANVGITYCIIIISSLIRIELASEHTDESYSISFVRWIKSDEHNGMQSEAHSPNAWICKWSSFIGCAQNDTHTSFKRVASVIVSTSIEKSWYTCGARRDVRCCQCISVVSEFTSRRMRQFPRAPRFFPLNFWWVTVILFLQFCSWGYKVVVLQSKEKHPLRKSAAPKITFASGSTKH